VVVLDLATLGNVTVLALATLGNVTVLALATLGNVTKIKMILFVSRRPKCPSQVKSLLYSPMYTSLLGIQFTSDALVI
jgi:hypothetical protein